MVTLPVLLCPELKLAPRKLDRNKSIAGNGE